MNNSTKATIPIKIFTTIFRLIGCQRCQNLHLKPLQNSGKNLQHSHISMVWLLAFWLLAFWLLAPGFWLLAFWLSGFWLLAFWLLASGFLAPGSWLLSPGSCLLASYFGLRTPVFLLPAPCSLPLAPCSLLPAPSPLPKCVNHVILSKSSVTALLQIQYNLVLIKLIINF